MTLDDLIELLEAYGSATVGFASVQARLLSVLAADPLSIEASESVSWDQAPAESRLFWRLVHFFDAESSDTEGTRHTARRVVRCLRQTGSAELTFELLPILVDQDRFARIAHRHGAAIISRTSLLSVIAESGYPAHIKLWLEHASPNSLTCLARALEEERYRDVATAFDAPPA